MSVYSEHRVYGYQMLLLSIDRTAGHSALEAIVDTLRRRDSASYLYFLQAQIKAKNETDLPHWEVTRTNGQYRLIKHQPK